MLSKHQLFAGKKRSTNYVGSGVIVTTVVRWKAAILKLPIKSSVILLEFLRLQKEADGPVFTVSSQFPDGNCDPLSDWDTQVNICVIFCH